MRVLRDRGTAYVLYVLCILLSGVGWAIAEADQNIVEERRHGCGPELFLGLFDNYGGQ